MQSLRKIAALLEDRKFKEAVEQTKLLNISEFSSADRAYFRLLEIEAKILCGEYDVDAQLDEVLEYYKSSTDTFKFAKAKYLHGWLLSLRGDYRDARESLIEAYVSFKRCSDNLWQARSLNRLGFICFTLGDIDSAVEHIQRAIGLYLTSDEEKHVISCTLNLATILSFAGKLCDATKAFLNLHDSIKVLKEKSLCIYHAQFSVVLAITGHIEAGKEELRKINSYIKDFPRERAIYYENLGWIHLLEEDYQSAEKALLEGLKISLEIAPKSALISQIKRRLADACFGLGQFEKAKKYADEAMVVAENINERVEIAACWRVYAQLEARDGNEPAARQWFTKAIDMFAMISSRYELAATRYLAAVSGMYHNGERQVLLYLAREYFESEDVRHYVEKIDREIKRTRRLPMPRRVDDNGQPPTIITVNPKMKKLVELAENVALADMTVLLTGPTGTGKDLLAAFIHYHSGRKGRFISVNSAAIPDQMIESELFGYKKGAYTGADKATTGLIECAEGGTFYLNEIADASPEMQAKLLDVIENRTVRRLGERQSRKIDFRVIAATNHDLEQMIRGGKFRADLYHRLNEIPITLPALADRLEDIPALLKHFLTQAKVSLNGDSDHKAIDRLAEVLSGRAWPGNVREFEAGINRLVFTSKGDLNRMIAAASDGAALTEREQLQEALMQTGWNRTEAARILGVSEGTIRNRIKKYDLTVAEETT